VADTSLRQGEVAHPIHRDQRQARLRRAMQPSAWPPPHRLVRIHMGEDLGSAAASAATGGRLRQQLGEAQPRGAREAADQQRTARSDAPQEKSAKSA
jgi:hypothetical protein